MSIRTVVESIMGGDEESDAESPEADGDFGGIGDDGGDIEGLDDGDGFGGMDESGDEFGGGGGAQVDELQHRIDEIETEIDDLSSTVETVRTENEQISASVGDVEENVRKLLDIYEMVTNGVNPFADDVEAGAGGGMGGDFGLFDDDGGDDGSDESVDQDVTEADPEGFFDEDLDEDDLAVDDEPAVDDVFGDEPATDPTDDGSAADPEPPEGGTSFEDLKAEYDDEAGGSDSERRPEPDAPAGRSETATPTDGSDTTNATDGSETAAPSDGSGRDTAPTEAEAEPRREASRSGENGPAGYGGRATTSETTAGADTGSSRADPSSAASEGAEHGLENGTEPAAEPGTIPPPEPQNAGAHTPPEPTGGHTRTNGGAARDQGDQPPSRGGEASPAHAGKPYLSAVPGGYATDLVVTEWLEFLVAKGGVREAASALEYYESIGWLSTAARERLEDRLGGFEGGGDGTLDTEAHERSLEYVSQLNGGGATAPAPTAVPDGGGSDGVQR